MSQPSFDPCPIAVDRYKNLARWRNLWTILLFVFGATVIAFACVSIVLFSATQWLPGAFVTIGAIAGGAGVGWVVTRRGEAVQEELAALEEVKAACAGRKAIVARAGEAEAAGGIPPEVLAYQRKLRLIGSIR